MDPFASRSRLIALLALLVAVGGALLWRVAAEVGVEPLPLAGVDYVQSESCIGCHPSHHESWSRTYHRTMTQDASPEAILADFENASYRYQGVTSRFTREGDEYVIETLDTGGSMARFPVARTVGSRRVQQYVTQIGDRYIRLPLAWNIEEGRWFHLAGGFLHPDGADFNEHTALWDANCIFCHNVKADPGYDWEAETFDSSVAELGIACEACHGPGDAHVAANRNPLRRYYLYLSGEGDPTIISPTELDPQTQVQTCGHCHGQRLPDPESRLVEFLGEGDPYTVGENLDDYTTPIWHDTMIGDFSFAPRFWGDGSPRLTAYEYQGLMLSAGHWGESELTCISCHSMHGGDPKGMIEEPMRGQEGCLQCHEEIREDIGGHTRHEPTSSGSDCYACHMPDVTYGLLATHPTHRIDNPDPSRAWRHEMPEACTLCHTDRSVSWAAAEFATLFDQPPVAPPDDQTLAQAEVVRTLLGGDVVQRAVAIEALRDDRSYTEAPAARLWAVPFLIVTIQRDEYPAIRHFAYRALTELVAASSLDPPPTPPFDALDEAAARQRVVEGWWAWWSALDRAILPRPDPAVPLDGALMPDMAVVEALIAGRSDEIIAIGE